MRLKIQIWTLLFLLAGTVIRGQDVTFTATAPAMVRAGEQFQYVIEGSKQGDVLLPNMEGFQRLRAGSKIALVVGIRAEDNVVESLLLRQFQQRRADIGLAVKTPVGPVGDELRIGQIVCLYGQQLYTDLAGESARMLALTFRLNRTNGDTRQNASGPERLDRHLQQKRAVDPAGISHHHRAKVRQDTLQCIVFLLEIHVQMYDATSVRARSKGPPRPSLPA